ncbi:MAG: EAL domain-containing protein [Pseudomonadales bacterium]|nr:EAL domain-containing protein [Pseudomonadales bacterium]
MSKTEYPLIHKLIRFSLALAIISAPLCLLVYQQQLNEFVAPHYFPGMHALLELLSIIVAAAIFIVFWHVVDDNRPKAALFLACGFLAVVLFDTAHLFSYTGMPDFFTPNTNQKTTLLWLLARLVAAISLFVYVFSPHEKQQLTTTPGRFLALNFTLLSVVCIVWLVLYFPEFFPQTQGPVTGVSDFKFISELFVVFLSIATLATLFYRWYRMQVYRQSALVMAIVLMILSESLILLYPDDRGISSFVSHFYETTAYIYLYRAIFLDSVRQPVKKLQQSYRTIQAFARQNEQLINSSPDAIVGIDHGGLIIFTNKRLEIMLGYKQQELIGQRIEILLPSDRRSHHLELRKAYQRSPSGRPMSVTPGLVAQHKDGRKIPVDIALGSHQGEHGVQVTAFIRDISERQKLQEELRHLAMHDALTGLPNRILIQDRLEYSLIQAKRNNSLGALMMIDLDNFKDINDGWGHSLGDKLLVAVADRLKCALRNVDTVGRFGGDEFIVLANDLSSPAAARILVQKVMNKMSNIFELDNHQLYVSISIGVVFYPGLSSDSELLLSQADVAMYQAKKMGRRTACYFDESMSMNQQETLRLKTWLTEAMATSQLALHYQPQYRLVDRHIVSFEALLRWTHPVAGKIPPDVFIPVAESSGLIIPLTEWVFETACTQIREWDALGLRHRICVNVSALHFRQHGLLLALVKQSIEKFDIDPDLLGLELTETALMDDTDKVISTLQQLVEIGVHLAIDDFGTGYSSLASLRMFPVQTLKIDRSFMVNLLENIKSEAILTGLVNLGKSLGMEVIAEGVETREQCELLHQCQCDVIQGWLMNPAMPESECTAMLQELSRQNTAAEVSQPLGKEAFSDKNAKPAG